MNNFQFECEDCKRSTSGGCPKHSTWFIQCDEKFPAPEITYKGTEGMELHPYTGWYSKREKKPHTCPVCGGTGQVPVGFYSEEIATCRSCDGSGVLWEKQ